MTWTRLSDTLNSDLRFMRLSDAAFRLHVKALVWSNQVLSDGLVPADALDALTYRQPNPEFLVAELVKVGLWQKLPDEDSWQMDWSDQEPSEDVERRKRQHADRNRRYRRRKDLHAAGDHSECDPKSCPNLRKRDASRDASRSASHDAQRDALPSRPVPSPSGTGVGGDAAEGPRVPPDEQPAGVQSESDRAAREAEAASRLAEIATGVEGLGPVRTAFWASVAREEIHGAKGEPDDSEEDEEEDPSPPLDVARPDHPSNETTLLRGGMVPTFSDLGAAPSANGARPAAS